jgi:hypothetical protein
MAKLQIELEQVVYNDNVKNNFERVFYALYYYSLICVTVVPVL